LEIRELRRRKNTSLIRFQSIAAISLMLINNCHLKVLRFLKYQGKLEEKEVEDVLFFLFYSKIELVMMFSILLKFFQLT